MKRGGCAPQVFLDMSRAEDQYSTSPRAGLTPEQTFDRRWALTLIERALNRLRDEYAPDRAALFEALFAKVARPPAASPTTKLPSVWG